MIQKGEEVQDIYIQEEIHITFTSSLTIYELIPLNKKC